LVAKSKRYVGVLVFQGGTGKNCVVTNGMSLELSDYREEAILMLRGGTAFCLVLNKGDG